MYTIIMVEPFMVVKETICQRCGIPNKSKFEIFINKRKTIKVCTLCFSWSMNKTQEEIIKDYNERTKKNTKKR